MNFPPTLIRQNIVAWNLCEIEYALLYNHLTKGVIFSDNASPEFISLNFLRNTTIWYISSTLHDIFLDPTQFSHSG
jgi:hypothetical protein